MIRYGGKNTFYNRTGSKIRWHALKCTKLWLYAPFLLLLIAGIFLTSICVASNLETQRLGLRDMVLGVHFITEKKGWAVGNFGLALLTTDGSESWQRVTISDEDSFKDVFFVEEKGWIVGERGIIFHTDNGGNSWTKQISKVETSLLSVFFLNAKKGFTVGGDGVILGTDDGGITWERIDPDWMAIIPEELMDMGLISIDLYDIIFSNETSGWIVGDSGTILRTLDGGKEWFVANIGFLPSIFSVCFKDDKKGWAVGHHGYFLKTDDGGQTWKRLALDTENSLYNIRMYKNYGVIVGDQATIFKTTDGGETWAKYPRNIPPPYPWFADAFILSSNSVKVVSVGESIILKTRITSNK